MHQSSVSAAAVKRRIGKRQMLGITDPKSDGESAVCMTPHRLRNHHPTDIDPDGLALTAHDAPDPIWHCTHATRECGERL